MIIDEHDRLLLAKHDLSARHMGVVLWAPPGGGLQTGETPAEAVLRELVEEVGYRTTPAEITHVWHQEIISPTYSKDWDGAVHDYFALRCLSFEPRGMWDAESLNSSEGITEFRWWTLDEMFDQRGPEELRPQNLKILVRHLLDHPDDVYPIDI
ncbi:NUDIX hydrolase [Nocardioides perillae]|uniref:ADP-ribose pyrophosphatase YjhB (NUDIX family) n=1 Tax=Nocardioides perillae TaxID=1119534 RepID=A0A7Y9UN08_9ACTN|nr:ADP-ribose pyrophosphatase YjhB (NUDIX family) [Nocardioides perillae]